jgi:DNA-binding IclR family transcriptional regulator
MARPAPAVERAVQILDFLADHPTDAFSLSELARRLDMNKASAHATLNALVDAGYLLRHPTRKDYHLGPRLMTVGEAARNQFPVVDFARDELRRLSDDLAMECLASTAVADEMVIVDRAGPVRPLGVTVAVGYRFPLVPPMGTVFMAWSSDDEINEWLRRVGPDVNESELARYRQALAAVRERGFSAGLDADTSRDLSALLATRDEAGRRDIGSMAHDEYQLIELEGADEFRLNTLGAPVFDSQGDVALGVFVAGFRGAQSADQIPDYADRLMKATEAITESIHGHRPET